MKYDGCTTANSPRGLSLIELLIAIGILGVTMMLIAAAFPAGVAMSIAVSDETTAGAVFQDAMSVIRDNYKISRIPGPDLPSGTYTVIPDEYLSWDSSIPGYNLPATGLGRRKREYEIAGQSSTFSWSALIRRESATTSPMGNLCHVIIIVSRQPTGNPNFLDEARANSVIPELRSVPCISSDPTVRTIEVDSSVDPLELVPLTHFERVPSAGYIIDSTAGTAYLIISRNNNDTVTLLTQSPAGVNHDFWLIPGPYDSVGGNYGRVSPAIRIFQTTLYWP